MVDLRRCKQIQHRSRRASARIRQRIHHLRQPRVQHGATAHRTGLQRYIERAAFKAVVAQGLRSLAHGLDLGMGRGIVALYALIVTSSQNRAPVWRDHDGTHRYFSHAR